MPDMVPMLECSPLDAEALDERQRFEEALAAWRLEVLKLLQRRIEESYCRGVSWSRCCSIDCTI